MSDPEIEVDVELAQGLLSDQFPEWAGLDVRPVTSGGTDNAMFRLGDELCMRMPRVHWAVQQVDKEQTWLPRLAPDLSLQIPRPVAAGQPGRGYPCRWSVYSWLDGEPPEPIEAAQSTQLATQVGAFVRELQAVPSEGGPAPGEHNFDRGRPYASWMPRPAPLWTISSS